MSSSIHSNVLRGCRILEKGEDDVGKVLHQTTKEIFWNLNGWFPSPSELAFRDEFSHLL